MLSSLSSSSSSASSSLLLLPSSSSVAYLSAHRHEGGGMCTGTLWKSVALRPGQTSPGSGGAGGGTTAGGGGSGGSFTNSHSTMTSSSSSVSFTAATTVATATDLRYAVPMYVVLVAHAWHGYESERAFARGDAPLHTWYAVAASVWSPHHQFQSRRRPTSQATHKQQNNQHHPSNNSFRLVTSQGTQVYCWTSTQVDRDTWLTALQAGLELSLAHPQLSPTVRTTARRISAPPTTTSTTTAPPPPTTSTPAVPPPPPPIRRSFFGSRTAAAAAPSSSSPTTITASAPTNNQCPVCQRFTEPSTATLTNSTTAAAAATTTTTAGGSGTNSSASMAVIVPTVSPQTGWPIPQCAIEDRCDALCVSCAIAQGVWHHVHILQCLYAAMATERSILATARQSCHAALQQQQQQHDQQQQQLSDETTNETKNSNDNEDKEDSLLKTTTTATSATNSNINETALVEWLQTAECVSWARQCSSFDRWRCDVLRSNNNLLGALGSTGGNDSNTNIDAIQKNDHQFHLVSGTDFIEWLDEAAGGQRRPETIAAAALKQQAVRVAGDMGTAMQLLLEQAVVPTSNSATSSTATIITPPANTEVLQCVLEFFLDLCDEGELSSVAFFWPQLCHIHLRMLPPVDVQSLARVELMEDFLLTVATRYSIHLCLELVWSHTADLEESLQMSPSSASFNSERASGTAGPKDHTPLEATDISPACRRRRFAVVRFLCELESLLFDFDGGWGGGTVSLGKILSPSPYQVEQLKQAVQHIQALRLETNHCVVELDRADGESSATAGSQPLVPHNFLTRSARFDMLSRQRDSKLPEEQAEEKLRITKNADYFTCHVNFSKRLADIAEKMRFMDLADRAACLEEDLTLLNCSGTMGGDPLNRLREHLIRVVRVPTTEGHVFRSKERAPVLLLMEVIDEMESEVPPAQAPPPQSTIPLNHDVAQGDDVKSTVLDEENLTTEDANLDNESAVGEDEICDSTLCPVPHSPSTKRLTGSDRATLEGALEGSRLSPGPKALKRFDKDGELVEPLAPTTPKRDVQLWVNHLAEGQLKELGMPDFTRETTSTFAEEASKASAPATNDSSTKNVSFRPSPQRDEAVRSSRKMSTLVSAKHHGNETLNSSSSLARTGDIRRAVLTTIMMRGLQGNSIAAGAADSAQRSLKEFERKRATELLLSDDNDASSDCTLETESDATKKKFLALGLSPSLEEAELASRPTEEDEAMEAIRLILIQNQVAQGKLSQTDAAKVLQHTSLSPINAKKSQSSLDKNGDVDVSEHPTIDAGDVDPRLVGCGPLPPAVLHAMTLWKGGMVTQAELLELVKKDIEFVKHSVLVDAENLDMLKENSAFWGRFAFGERWAEKKSRIGSSSPQGSIRGWDMMGVIVKSNDDLRQEAFVMQLIELCQEAFELADLELWVSPYRIIATGRSTGVIECVRNAMSFDALKKRPGYGKGGLREHLQRMTEFTADPGGAFVTAQHNFVRSLAAYSLMSYFFLFKDRHNGNLLLDTAGHVIHIDFGFVFGIAPGGSFSLEMSTPFKLTEEMLDVMGGLRSPLFAEFVTLFCCGFLALQLHCDTFLTLVEITSKDSTFNCFDGRDNHEIVSKLRERFCPDLNKEDTISFALDLIKQATTSYGTRQYDLYQYLSQGIVA